MHRQAAGWSARPRGNKSGRRRPPIGKFTTLTLGLCAIGTIVGPVANATPAAAPHPLASGSPGGSLGAQAAQLAATIDSLAARIHALSLRYLVDEAQARQLATAERVTVAELAAARSAVAVARAKLSAATIAAYVNAGTGSSLNLLFSPSSSTADGAAASQAYLSVATINLQQGTQTLQASLARLAGTLAGEKRARAAVTSNLRSLAATRTRAYAAIAAEEAALSSVNSQIAALVATAEAAAAQRVAEQAAAAAGKAPPPPPKAPPQGPPLPAGPPSVGIPSGPSPSLLADFAKLRQCESGGSYTINTGNGFYGAYQFSLSTWQGLGYSGVPSNASPATQDAAAYKLWHEAGWSPWPACSVLLGL